MSYPKINSLWKRKGWNPEHKGQKDRQEFIRDDYVLDEYKNIVHWDVEEKIDGTNIQVKFKNGTVIFGGRTEDSQIPCHLLEYLQTNITSSLMQARFKNSDGSYPDVVLFGEGYGPKIQKGGYYSKEPGFCLFDVKINGTWMDKSLIRNIMAPELGLKTPPFFGLFTQEEIVEFVKQKKPSYFAENDPEYTYTMEGVVCRSHPLMLTRNHERILFKLRCEEKL